MSIRAGRLLLTSSLAMAGVEIRAQTNWSLIAPPLSPPPSTNAASCYDSVRGRLLVFGGFMGSVLFSETWEFDGRTWHQMLPPTSPPPRLLSAMAFDARRGRSVLFGGRVDYLTGRTVNDTWEWDGVDWREVAVGVPAPAPRSGHDMAFDTRLQRIVLFGGGDVSAIYSDTWTWDGGVWTPMTPATSPPPRGYHAMAYDSHRQRLVMFGGVRGTAFGDTWEWDGSDWAMRMPTASPSPRAGHRMAFDPDRRRVVLFGGGSVLPADTFEWDGTNWALRATASAPPVRYGHVMAYLPGRRQVVKWSGDPDWGRTWVYGPVWPAEFVPYGSGCPGRGQLPRLDVVGLPYLGQRLEVWLSGAAPSTPAMAMVGFTETSFDLGAIGAPGCFLLLSVSASVGMRTDAQGLARLSLTVPIDSGLIGRLLFTQFAVQDTAANPLGWITTHGGRATFGAP